MGDEADYIFDTMSNGEVWEVDDWVNDIDYQSRFDNNIWTTQDGRQMILCEMETRHLLNCVGWIRTRGPNSVFGFGSQWLPKLEAEIQRRRK